MSDENNDEHAQLRSRRPPTFSDEIGRLIKEIGELGRFEELRSMYESIKRLPQMEFEHRLVQLRNGLARRN